jgi:hypothetical protein
MQHLRIDSLLIDNGTVLAEMEVSPKRFIPNGGKIMAKKTLKKAKKLEATKPLSVVNLGRS